MEIDENLCRAELTAAQRTQFKNRRKQIWEALHPEEIAVRQAVAPQSQSPMARPQAKGFAASTAKVTGESVRSVQREIARAEAIGDEALSKVVNTSLDSGVELDALAKLPEPERKVLIDRAVAGEVVTARAIATDTAKPPQPRRANIFLPKLDDANRAIAALNKSAAALKAGARSVFAARGIKGAQIVSLRKNLTDALAAIDRIEADSAKAEQNGGAV